MLREALSLDLDGEDDAADRLFIETQQFSERVGGIEVWEKPVLPWIKPKPNTWLPEGFGLRIGNDPDSVYLELKPGEAEALSSAVEAAQKLSEEVVAWRDVKVPATRATADALRGLVDLERETARHSDGDPRSEPSVPLETFFLQVGQNFERLDYARLPQPQKDGAPLSPVALPSNLTSTLKPHQEVAFQWLTAAWARRLPGVLLADDMGLGKTFQALAFISWLRTVEMQDRPVLIVAPTGLLRNWQNEILQHLEPGTLGMIIEAFGQGLSVYREAKGSDIRGGTSRLNVDNWRGAGVVLTTYETMRDYHMSFARLRFSAIVYDEVQKLKNPSSQMARAAKALNADMQIAMTGTPVENRLQDLWSISDTIYPGLLGTSREFEQSFPADDRARLAELQSLLIEPDRHLPPFMLRRMKDEILTGLPEKRTEKYEVPMPPEQARAYDLVLSRARALKQSGSKGAMLKVLHLLRGTSLHPRPPHAVNDIAGYIAESARLSKTFALLADIRKRGEKALIFCEDIEMQEFLAMAVQEHFGLNRRPDCIHGGVTGSKRQDIVARFQAGAPGFDVMILSPKAGGVGLTITAANHVIHLSRWWNPAVEDQATDRVYRIGQHRPVTVHLPLAIHPDARIGPSSFDKNLDELMTRKRALSSGLLMPPETGADLEDLLGGVLSDAPGEVDADVEEAKGVPEDYNSLRPTFSKRPVLSPVVSDVPRPQRRFVGRVHYEEQKLRDWTIFQQYLQDKLVERLRIEDPYCLSDRRSRTDVVEFVAKLEKFARRITTVHVIAFDADSVESRFPENSRQQREDLEQQWDAKPCLAKLSTTQRSRRAAGDFHDRSVTAILETGDQVVWDLGRGIKGIMDQRRSCIVNATLTESVVL
jgi:superfamily II DNA or RNA helicase